MELVFFVGAALVILGGIPIISAAFKSSPLLGVGGFFLAPLFYVYVLTNWHETKKPFMCHVAGLGLLALSTFLGEESPV